MSIIKDKGSQIYKFFREGKNKELQAIREQRAEEIKADYIIKKLEGASDRVAVQESQKGGEFYTSGKVYLFSHLTATSDQNVPFSPRLYEVVMDEEGFVTVNTPDKNGLATATFVYDPSKYALAGMHSTTGRVLPLLGKHGNEAVELWKQTGLVPQETIFPLEDGLYRTDETQEPPLSLEPKIEVKPVIGTMEEKSNEQYKAETGYKLFGGEIISILKDNAELQNYISSMATAYGLEGQTMLEMQRQAEIEAAQSEDPAQ